MKLECFLYHSLNTLYLIMNDVTQLPDDHSYHLLLFGSPAFNEIASRMFLDVTVNFIIHTNHFKRIRHTIKEVVRP